MKLSVIIPTYNRCALLSRTLATILQQHCSPHIYEVIVVMDGSSDGSAQMLRRVSAPCAFRVLEQPNRGPSAARNRGLETARGDLVLFLDDDLLCDSNLVPEHIAGHRNAPDQVVFGPVHLSRESPPTLSARWTGYMARLSLSQCERNGLNAPLGAHFAPNTSAPRAHLLAIGGFDEVLFPRALEDYDVCYRLWRKGLSFRFRPSAITHQVYIKSTHDLVHGDGEACGKSEVKLYRKHPDFRRYSQFGRGAEDGMVKRTSKKFATRVHLPFDSLASVPCWLADRLPASNRLERIGLRFLSARRSVAILRSALAETGGWRNFRREFATLLPVLLYRHVGPRHPVIANSTTIPPGRFEKQIRWLKHHDYVGILSKDWLAWCRGEKSLPDRPVMLTFDDADADLAEHALPVLKRYGYPGTVFVVTGQIGASEKHDQKNGVAQRRRMSAEEIRLWAAHGIEFGACTRSHPNLNALSDEELQREIAGSAKDLSDLLGARARSFAYPYGHYTVATKKYVESAFDLAFTCTEGVNGLATDPHLLRRTVVGPHNNLLDLFFYLRLGSSPLNRLRPGQQRRCLTSSLNSSSQPAKSELIDHV